MGILRYILQGVGWEIGRQAAREGIDGLRVGAAARDASTAEAANRPTPRDDRRAARVARRQHKRQAAELERQLRELKDKARRG